MTEVNLRKGVLGSDWDSSVRLLRIAIGMFSLLLLVDFVSNADSSWASPGIYLFFVCWTVSFVVAGYSAYKNSGILTSWVIVLSPVLARQIYFTGREMQAREVSTSVGPGTFGLHHWPFWISTSLFLGTLCFGIGVALRWGMRYWKSR